MRFAIASQSTRLYAVGNSLSAAAYALLEAHYP